MTNSYPLKNLPAPAQMLIRPMLLASLGLHGLLLFLPTGSDENPILAKKQEAVKITQLSSSPNKPAKSLAKSSAQKESRSTRQVVQSNRPRSIVTPQPQGAKTDQSSGAAKAQSGTASDQAEAGSENPFADFPHYPGVKTGCFDQEACRQTADALDQVVAHFEKQLPAKKYEVQSVTNEAGKKVYQVSKGGKTQYLNLFTDAVGTIYVLAPEPLELADIKGAIAVPDELYVLIGEIDGETASDTDFEAPLNFYTKLSQDDNGSVLPAELGSGIEGAPKLISGKTPEQVYSDLQPKLQKSGLEALPADPYGGGSLYKLQKGTATAGYLNLVPGKKRTDTIVIIWTSSPN